jgi:hypothetical protein
MSYTTKQKLIYLMCCLLLGLGFGLMCSAFFSPSGARSDYRYVFGIPEDAQSVTIEDCIVTVVHDCPEELAEPEMPVARPPRDDAERGAL